jgi:hypothetical protein
MKQLIFTLFVLLSIMTAGAQEFVIIATGSNGQPEAYTLDEISSWGYTGDKFFINDENQAQVFSATGDKFNFSSAEQEEGEYFVATFPGNPGRQARFLIGSDLRVTWKDSKLTVKDKNRSKEFLLDVIPELSIEAGTYGYVDPYISDARDPMTSSLWFRILDAPFSVIASFSDAYMASIDKDYFYFVSPAGTIKFARAEYKYFGINIVPRGTTYR